MINDAEYNTPNKRKRFVEAERQKILETIENDRDKTFSYLEGPYGTRRKTAILNCMDRALEDFGCYGMKSVMETIVREELMPVTNYNMIDYDYDLLIAAAIWILDKLRASGKLRDAFSYLPDVSQDADAWYLPDGFYHPCYSESLIHSVIHLMAHRYDREGQIGRKRRLGYVLTEENACGKKPEGPYANLLKLLPSADVDKACQEFRKKVWELVERRMRGQAFYDREIEKYNQQFRGGMPGMAADSVMDALERSREMMDREHDFFLYFDDFLQMDRKKVRRILKNREAVEALTGFTVTDPYELCFALLYLIDTDDDAAWLVHSGSSLMAFCLHMLPWYVDISDWDEKDWEDWEDGMRYDRNGWTGRGPVADPIDYLHEKHNGRNIAQIIYDLCRGVVPLGLHPFETDRERLVAEGMDEDKARNITQIADLLFLADFQAKPEFNVNLDWNWPMPARETGNSEEEPEEKIEEIPADTGLEEENERLKQELAVARKQLKNLRDTLAVTRQEAGAERAKYEHELKDLRMEHRELADLRDLVFHREAEDPARLEKPDKVYAYPYETKKRTVVFGGHDTFLKAIKPMLPSVKFVNTAILSFDPNIIRNADVVWIQNNCISHSQFGSIVKQCKRAGVQMRYFGYASAEKCAEQLVTEDLK